MKQRVITGIVIILILIPIFLSKMLYDINHYIYILGFILAIIAMNEMISMKESEKNLPFEIHLLAYLSVIYISFYESLGDIFSFQVKESINILPYIIIILTIAMVLRKKFKIVDASFMLFAIFYIGLTFHSLVYYLLAENGMYVLLYLILIAMFTDTFAYFSGTLFGKHKLCPSISPKKTIEGSLGGTIIATILVSIYAIFSHKIDFLFDNSMIYIIGLTFVLSILSQFGDLAASVLKRHYKIKDYGNLFPGHGGVLDRLDSILFVSLTYYYITEFLTLVF
ncbi:phosphatidate cytidylyltransferase [Mycoplasmatota bacterium]|nr:phosphatidate cytidylyltransferase [Mycoplasmatota bacterium]